MRLLVQWSTKHPRGWIEVDSKVWAALAKKPVPVGGETIDDEPGWLSNVCVQGQCTGSADHVAVEHLGDSVRVTSWNDDPEDYKPGQYFARVTTFHPLKPDAALGGAVNTDIETVFYGGSDKFKELKARDFADAEVRPWSEFTPPPEAITRHGIWVTDKLADAHRKLAVPPSWRTWGEGGDVPCQRDLGRWAKAKGTITFYWRGTNGGGGTGDDADAGANFQPALGGNFLLTENSTTVHDVIRDVLKAASQEISFAWTSEPLGVAEWPTGDYHAQIDINANESADVTCYIQILQVVSTGSPRDTFGTSAGFADIGTHLYTISSHNPPVGVTSDRYQVRVLCTNAEIHSNREITLGVRSADSYADGPWTAPVQDSDARDARTEGQATTTSDRDARTVGGLTTSATRDARTRGGLLESATRDARTAGEVTDAASNRGGRTAGKVSDLSSSRGDGTKGWAERGPGTTTYYMRGTSGGSVGEGDDDDHECSPGAYGYKLTKDYAAQALVDDTVPGTTNNRICFSWTTDSPEPPTPWPSGDYTAQVDVVLVDPDIVFRIQLVRIKVGDCTVEETIGTSGNFSGTGLHLYTATGVDPGDTGRFQVRLIADNSNASPQQIKCNVRGTNSYAEGPWRYSEDDTRDARTAGKITDLGDTRDARTMGGIKSASSRDARTEGYVTGNQVSATRDARTAGVVTDAASSRDARTAGHVADVTSDRDARTAGQVADFGSSRDARTEGVVAGTQASDTRDARTAGEATASATRDARTFGGLTTSATRDARTLGQASVNDKRGARTSGLVPVTPKLPPLPREKHPDPSEAGGRTPQAKYFVIYSESMEERVQTMFPKSKRKRRR
jgi:hypothetical protein